MNFFRRVPPVWPLRITLGLMYLYSGIDLVRHPTAWVWALPYWLRGIISHVVDINTYLRFQGGVELIFALMLLAWFLKPTFVKWAALFSTLEFAAILILAFLPWSETNFLFTFRDIGLLGASFALTAILFQKEASQIPNF